MKAVSALLGAALAVVPLQVPGAAARSDNGSLVITTLGRAGTPVPVTAQIVNLSDHSAYTVASGKPYPLPQGRYAVLADIWNAKDDTDTLAAETVQVSGTTEVTFDARLGRPVKVSLDHGPGPGFPQQFTGHLCVTGTPMGQVGLEQRPGRLFVIPGGSPEVRFAYLSQWTGNGAEAGHRYEVSGVFSGLPHDPVATYRTADLATVRINARRGPTSTHDTRIDIRPADKDICLAGLRSQDALGPLPFTLMAHLSPGRWQIEQNSPGAYLYTAPQTYRAGRLYTQQFNRAAWGPAHALPYVDGHRLHADPNYMFVDPDFADSAFSAPARTTTVLSQNGRVIERRVWAEYANGPGRFDPYLGAAGWYDLTMSADRYQPGTPFPPDMLSTASSLELHFHADPLRSGQLPVFLTRFEPGVDDDNSARPGSTTSVVLRLDGPGPNAPRTVTVRASHDDGATWQQVNCAQTNGAWTAFVPNPGSGPVSLRATVTDLSGNEATTTVQRAYAVD